MPPPFFGSATSCGMRQCNSFSTKEGGRTFQMHNIKRSIEYGRRASSVFVKPLTQQSALTALGNKRHSRFALHPRSKTIRLRIKQGMAARAGDHGGTPTSAPPQAHPHTPPD